MPTSTSKFCTRFQCAFPGTTVQFTGFMPQETQGLVLTPLAAAPEAPVEGVMVRLLSFRLCLSDAVQNYRQQLVVL
eukprot:4075665-Amphidinium_carterae.2